ADPLLIKAGQERAVVEFYSPRQVLGLFCMAAGLCGSLERLLKLQDIRGDGGRVQPDTEAIGAEDRSLWHSRWLELIAEAGEGDREAVPQGRHIAFRPEQFDEDLTGVRLAQIVGQIRKERGDLLGLEPGDDLLTALCPQSPQEHYLPLLIHCDHHRPCTSRA